MSKEELSPSLRSGNTTILFHRDYKASLLQQAVWPQSDSLEIAMEIRTHAFKDLIAVVIQSLSHVRFFATPWTAARQASLSFTISWSLLKLLSIESVMPSNHLILCPPLFLFQSFPVSGSFLMSQLFASVGQSIGTSASDSVLPVNIQV